MLKRTPPLRNKRQAILACHFAAHGLFVILLLAGAAQATPLNEYHQHVRQSVTALEALGQSGENETTYAYSARDADTVRQVRGLMPPSETIEVDGASVGIDNTWLHQDLDKYAADTSAARYELLKRITERVKALDERLDELEKAAAVAGANKADDSRRLEEILKRPEYVQQVQQKNALTRLLERLVKWIASWFPRAKPMSPGGVGILSQIAKWVVILLALGVLAYVLKMFLPRLFRNRSPRKKGKEKARIVLGEILAPDQTALDLLSEAEALARRGELRAAIRRAYIALLVELGERKIISLAQYKTNRDYLRAMREIEPLYRNVKQLTDSFERHWYGLVQADETDWLQFRSGYNQALTK
ncbi:MAG TPA: DUF4129 domain-containing protein [Pyrinomonadaceae bacterium]|jgi:hypothetical protein|nr:DUF4129 domain-containing protein [Pyrinomonadaceae bacterium]